MPVQSFTRNYEDNSTEAGFQFTFKCDICGDGYKTSFIQSKTFKKKGFWIGLGKVASIGQELTGISVGNSLQRGTEVMSERFEGMTPDWHKEHEQAFEVAQNEAKRYIKRCQSCNKYVCEKEWNEQEGRCVQDAVSQRLNNCPQCGKPTSSSKFCNNCGASLGPKICSKCAAKNPPGTSFCGECGTSL
jgi:hypothetical protein